MWRAPPCGQRTTLKATCNIYLHLWDRNVIRHCKQQMKKKTTKQRIKPRSLKKNICQWLLCTMQVIENSVRIFGCTYTWHKHQSLSANIIIKVRISGTLICRHIIITVFSIYDYAGFNVSMHLEWANQQIRGRLHWCKLHLIPLPLIIQQMRG